LSEAAAAYGVTFLVAMFVDFAGRRCAKLVLVSTADLRLVVQGTLAGLPS
jgi:hypothetical protein